LLRVLSIGNSFSQDAQRYLHGIAKVEGMDIKCVNLYIGGCSLQKHYINILENYPVYDFEFMGESTGIKVSINQALVSDDWDFITLQQVSYKAPYYETYQPYLNGLADHARKYSPKSKILMHETWAYEQGSDRLTKELGFQKSEDMYDKIRFAYIKAAETIDADGIIPSGQAMMIACNEGIGKMYRDTFHADYGIGRYLLGLVWYRMLTGNFAQNKFREFDVAVDEKEAEKIQRLLYGLF